MYKILLCLREYETGEKRNLELGQESPRNGPNPLDLFMNLLKRGAYAIKSY